MINKAKIKTVKIRQFFVGVFGCFLLMTTFTSYAEQLLKDWHMYGSNTLRGSLYEADGPGAVSPYPFEGDMYFNELSVYLDKRNSQYDVMRAEVTGLLNLDDKYRASHNGIVPERMSFVRENGEANTPYRLEMGDHFAYFSYLTLQRSLKGMQVEFQPGWNNSRRRHSFVFTTGADESDWNSLTLKDNYTTGVSWLIQDQSLGSYNFNLVHNYRDNSVKLGTLQRKQYVASVAGEREFDLEEHNVTLEAEVAHFVGDHNGVTGALSGQDRAENGYFVQLSGQSKSLPWDYRYRVDYYGQDFQPQGAIVTADRRSFEMHHGWLHQSGIRSRGRVQFFEDALETTNTTSTRTYGVNFTGPLLKKYYPDVNGSLDAFMQKRDNQTGAIDTFTRNLNLSLTKPLRHGWVARTSVFLQNVDDESTTNADIFTRQFTLSADHAISIAGFKGVISPGILLRAIRKSTNFSTDASPTLAMSLNRGPHALRADYSGLFQGRDITTSGADIDTHQLNMDYQYSKRQHLFGLEANFFGRDTDITDSTDAYRISAYWTYNFDRPPVTVARTTTSQLSPGEVSVEVDATIIGLAPGATEDNVNTALSRAGISGGVSQSGFVVYETPLLNDVFHRQRIALEFAVGSLERSALIIDFDNVGDRDTTLQTYERTKQTLIKQLGNPTRVFERGDFTTSFIGDVNAQRIIRIVEWSTPQGVIRFGIPRRLDGQVRMEIQHARKFPQIRDTLWSIEDIR
ncbi:MAG: hypothetical protein HND53_10725 [Proteobacteria bacterium]|nr:hypothetical protein [Pseudomonadota bacterium]NOG60965.1 hypothetical protein [Pseudomonadota bacterium]